MDAWILATIAAAFLQNLRFLLQKRLAGTHLSTAGATFARFVWGAPLAVALVAALLAVRDTALPGMDARFWLAALAGGVAQIMGTVFVVALFGRRNFAVGITLKKTETFQTALVGFVVLGEAVPPAALGAIAVGFAGVVLLSDPPTPAPGQGWARRLLNPSAGLGLGAGAMFGISATGYRAAGLALEGGDALLRAAVTLAAVTTAQALVMGAWLAWRERGEIRRVFRHWRITGLVGLTSVAGSLGWFTAFTLQTAAYVQAVGQVELVFTLLTSWLVFREKSTRRELTGIALVVASILALVLLVG